MTSRPTKKKPAAKSGGHLQATDLRAVAQLATNATQAVTAMSEGVHQAVWRTLGAPSGATIAQTRGLTGLIYQSITGVTQLIGQGAVSALTRLEPLLQQLQDQPPESAERAAVIAALNGVMGDRLQADNNPLATPMTLRHEGLVLNEQSTPTLKDARGRLMLVMHGLCMNDLQWATQNEGTPPVNHATAMAQALDASPVYLRYNTGLHVSQNGHALAQQLETLISSWPTPLSDITVLVHSMGGLVIRSALHVATLAGLTWPQRVKRIFFLGTPHHGSPLERAGNWVDVILGSTPYSRPFAKLGQLRSAGVTDLRYGHVLDADWKGHNRFRRRPDTRQHVPLPDGIDCFAVAATVAAERSALADRLVGDGLVPLHSALGQHDDPARQLLFAPERQHIVYLTGHMQLLSNASVTQQLLQWLQVKV